ncbi:unnamed protein product [Dracunculus medinensis]|uniref:Cilia- and flagella-associated protein 43 n=1 Tax=Dracunculus medinensis TaxID=318479 RepID=A0A158Q508_DRAME|nr:unnamed protein product [Dracunculus medinensis]
MELLTDASDNIINGCIAYCGGPISAIKACPMQLKDGRECVAVSVFHDEEHLVKRNTVDLTDYIQLWLFTNKEGSVVANLSFMLETKVGAILSLAWCPSVRHSTHYTRQIPLSNLLGILAVAGMQGNVLLYRIFTDLFDQNSSDNPIVYRAKPFLSLKNPEVCLNAPIFSLAWTEYEGASKIAAVSAFGFFLYLFFSEFDLFFTGAVLLWDLNNLESSPFLLKVDDWSSPPSHVVFNFPNQLVVSFREKFILIYDYITKEVLLEEGASRTAGAKVASCERLFKGFVSYQCGNVAVHNPTQSFTSHSVSAGCYITCISTEGNFFVVPIINRHEICVWEMAFCPLTGALMSVGGDGRLVVSLNGRIVPHGTQRDVFFKACRVLMTVIRKPNDNNAWLSDTETNEKGSDLKAPATNLELSAQASYLEINFEDIKQECSFYLQPANILIKVTFQCNQFPIQSYSIDLRTESLNVIDISQASGRLAICGGEAGLLIFMPCIF